MENAADEVVESSPKGRFARFNRKLGAGSYKIVYLGFDNDTGREVAWNVIAFTHMSKTERKRARQSLAAPPPDSCLVCDSGSGDPHLAWMRSASSSSPV